MRLNLNRCVQDGFRPCVRVRMEGDEREDSMFSELPMPSVKWR